MHCQIKEVTRKNRGNGTTTCVEAKYGTIIMETDKILDRWSEYIGQLYDDDRGEMPVITTGSISPITYQEVEYDLKWMPMRKSPGPNNMVTEMLVAAGDMEIDELTKLSNMMYIQGGFPSELNKSIFITLPKVNGATKCEKHRTISLMSHITKLVYTCFIDYSKAFDTVKHDS